MNKFVKHTCLFLTIITLYGCSGDPSSYVQNMDGYWEIYQVKKDNDIIKEYTINGSVDYFKVHEDLTGYRKKVMPNFDGSFTISDHETPFKLSIDDQQLHIKYKVDTDSIEETILSVSEDEMRIKNQDGFIYIYKPFEKLSIIE